MCGFARFGAICLLFGLTIMVAVPTSAKAMTPINLFTTDAPFPESVNGDTSLPETGIVIAFNQASSPRFSAFSFENGSFWENGFGTEIGTDVTSPTFGLVVAVSRNLGLQIWPFLFGENGFEQVGFGPGENPASGGLTVPAGEGPEAGSPSAPAGSGAVSSAPEPATWIMMICGFWIVAWRLRNQRQMTWLKPAASAA